MAKRLYQNKYRQDTRRNRIHDYGSNCWYLVTINTYHRKPHFGRVVTSGHGPTLLLSPIAHIAMKYWYEIPNHYPYVKLGAFVVMPDHIHGLVKICTEEKNFSSNQFAGQKNNLGSAINGFKSSVKRYANKNQINFVWQPRYHDVIIYTQESLDHAGNYIKNNLINLVNTSWESLVNNIQSSG